MLEREGLPFTLIRTSEQNDKAEAFKQRNTNI
jgi:hypothetical protein